MKPSVFVGSSVEAIDWANAVQQNLDHTADIIVWTQDVFEPSGGTLESLLKAAASHDFAIFVLHPDDKIRSRGKESGAARDNVLFELGMFLGALNRQRVFAVMPRDKDLHIPTDFLGITIPTYDSSRTDGREAAALGPACTAIGKQIKRVGLRGRFDFDSNDSVGIHNSMNRWLSQSGRVAIVSRNMSWASAPETIKLLKNKAADGDLVICAEERVELLSEIGAETYIYGKAEFTPRSRFTIVGFGRPGARVAVGNTNKGRHLIREYDDTDGTAFHMAEDLVSLLRKVGEQM